MIATMNIQIRLDLNGIVTQVMANPRQEVFSRYINCKSSRKVVLNLSLKSSADLFDCDSNFTFKHL